MSDVAYHERLPSPEPFLRLLQAVESIKGEDSKGKEMRQIAGMVSLVLVGLVGCGGDGLPPPVPVSGTITLKGKAVADATVTFLSTDGGTSASGKTGSDGTFKLTTVNTDDGARPGEYTITIAKVDSKFGEDDMMNVNDDGSMDFGDAYGKMMDASATGNMSKMMENQLPAKYAEAGTSDLKRTVVKGEANDFAIDLE